MTFRVPLKYDSDSSLAKRDDLEVHMSYGTVPGHESTNLNGDQLYDLFYSFLAELAFNRDTCGGCGELNNGGGWEAYMAVTTGGDNWGDCTNWIQEKQLAPMRQPKV